MFDETVEEGLEAVDERLRMVVRSDVAVLDEASLHIIGSGGKRVRPRLVLLSFLAAGGQDLAEAVGMAAAVEMVHTATLVHDDINDHSVMRRGHITVHERWGRTFALLTGDYLFTKVYEMMAPYGAEINSILAEATVQLVEGETLQAAAAKSGRMDRTTYKKIIARKTASLFRAAAHMGARLAGAHEETVAALSAYAYNLGMAFQIVDDILDIVGDPETLGKPIGGDVVQGTGAILAQNSHRQRPAEGSIAEADGDPFKQMLAELRDSGVVEMARAEAQELAERARDALYLLPVSPARDELEAIIDLVLEREA